MDISFTNVLEGARQYFQGLPAATTSSSGPQPAELGQRENDGSIHSEQHSAVPYWDHQNEGQGANVPATRDVVVHHRPGGQNPPAGYQHQGYGGHPPTPQVSHSYHPSSSGYYEAKGQPPKVCYAVSQQQAGTSSSNSYKYHHGYPAYSYPQTANTSSSQDTHYNYKLYNQQASRAQAQPQQQSYPGNYYQTTSASSQLQHRPTHQLPTLPTEIYHKRSVSKPIQHHPNTVNYHQASRPVHNPPSSVNHSEQRIPLQNGTSYSNQYKYYQNSPKFNAVTTTTAATAYSGYNYVDTRVRQVPQMPQSNYVPHVDAKLLVASNPQKLASISKQKRESPLDLSVKTVKTSADSTLIDNEDRAHWGMQKFQTARAPKVDFAPNFTMPSNAVKEDARKNYYNYSVPSSREQLPRVDFPSISKNASMELHRKRVLEQMSSAIPEKIPKVDDWRQTIDRQIEQKLSTYTKLQQQDQKSSENINGNKPGMYHDPQQRYSTAQTASYKLHSTPNVYQYQQQYPSVQQHYQRPSILQQAPNKQQTANKKVLNLLRNSLHMKGAKEAAKKKEQEQLLRHSYSEVQQPSTDVMAPLQPKPGIVGRRNVSPFTAASLERNSSTPPNYKFHLPKAIDSVIFSDTEKEQQETGPATTDLDGLAAFLAARIRTKAELKQAPMDQASSFVPLVAAAPQPPATPKKLFSRSDSGDHLHSKRTEASVRSSSETSVFDFPDSDNEAEMPVLERQSLVDMRKDRKTVPAQFTSKVEQQEGERVLSPFEMIFNQTCDTFMEQLKAGAGKKRGRRKKGDSVIVPFAPCEIAPCEIAPCEITTRKITPCEITPCEITPCIIAPCNIPPCAIAPCEIKKEPEDTIDEITTETLAIKIEIEEPIECKTESHKSESDSDTPLIVCKNKIKSKVAPDTVLKPVKCELDKDASSDSELEGAKIKAISTIHIGKPGKKPVFGDGSQFHPGWEEELYRYKKSLRMPRMLIQVTRPPNCKRLSTSLPDLDPCPPSPAPSSVTDADDKRKIIKSESIESDLDSNCSFNFSMSKINYDSEGSSSIKSISVRNNSILDKLLERYGGKKRKRAKKIEDGPKIIPKADRELELLPTPGLEVTKPDAIIKTNSVLLGFRKKTVDNFKDAFINNSKALVGINEFRTVVLKSRTRKETRVLKEKATIREVFGEDRPASAPPVTCLDEIKPDDEDDDKSKPMKKPADKLTALFNKNLNEAFMKALANKKINDELAEAKKDVKTDGETIKKRSKFRSIRRKFSSGFDYIRKKKKQVKKEDVENEARIKVKKRLIATKATPETVQDIQKEIKVWVLNKGVGETHLHRASRSGYTDITAYCLEKMNCVPSPKDNAGYTPLHEACSRGHLDIARLLLQYGAQVSESAQGGIRPLHEAAENGFVEIVRLLLSYGADPTLATYSGITPLQLAVDDTTVALLTEHLYELQGKSTEPWSFNGPSCLFDPAESGFDPLSDSPDPDPLPDEEDIEFEVSDQLLPNLYAFPDSETDRWVILQDLTNYLKIKSKETLLRQLMNEVTTANSVVNKSDIVREMKTADFLEQARCCQFLNANEKLSTRSAKTCLVKYTDKVKRLLNIETVVVSAAR